MLFSQVFEPKLFPNSICVFIIFVTCTTHIEFTIESFPQRELLLFKPIPSSHIFMRIGSFLYEFILILAILLDPKNSLPPISRWLTRESKLLLINLKLSINLSLISLLFSTPFLLMYLLTSTLIEKDM